MRQECPRADPGFRPCAGALRTARIGGLGFFEAKFHKSSVTNPLRIASLGAYLFFHPPRCPGAPPLERGAGPNSGPDWRESVGWKILLPLPAPRSSGEGFR